VILSQIQLIFLQKIFNLVRYQPGSKCSSNDTGLQRVTATAHFYSISASGSKPFPKTIASKNFLKCQQQKLQAPVCFSYKKM